MVTGRQPGHDVDGGRTTARSPYFTVSANGKGRVKLRYWVGLTASAGPDDGFAVRLIDSDGKRVKVLHKVLGNGTRQAPKWRAIDKRFPAELAGKRVAIELEAVDAGGDAIVEAAVDQVRVTNG